MASEGRNVTNFVRIVILVAVGVLLITVHLLLNSNEISLQGEELLQRIEQKISTRIKFRKRNENEQKSNSSLVNGSSEERKIGKYGLDTKTNLVVHDKRSGRFCQLWQI